MRTNLIISVMGFMLLWVIPVHAAELTRSWGAPATDADGTPITAFAGDYRLCYGMEPGKYTQCIPVKDLAPEVTYKVLNLTSGQKFCFAVKSVNTLGNESAYSNEVCETTPTIPAPTIPGTPEMRVNKLIIGGTVP